MSPPVTPREGDSMIRKDGEHEVTPLNTRGKNWVPPTLRLPSTIALCSVFILVAIALEVVLYRSNQIHGFGIPSLTLDTIRVNSTQGFSLSSINLSPHKLNGNEAAQFLKSFVPNIVFVPILYITRKVYQELKLLQPYVDLAHGGAAARNSITLEYLSQSPFAVAKLSVSRRHWLLTAASVVILWSAVFSSLAGSLFVVRLATISTTTSVALAGALGLNTIALGTPSTFASAAGNIDSAIFSGGSFPPFVYRAGDSNTDGWMIPPFDVQTAVNSDGSANVTVDTQVLNIHVQCVPATITPIKQGDNGTWTFGASLSQSCSETFSGQISGGFSGWLGVMAAADLSCVPLINSTAPSAAGLPAPQRPIAIGFSANGTAASAAFCYGYQKVFNATASYNLGTGRVNTQLTNVKYIANHPLEQYVMNGVEYENSLIASTNVAQVVGLIIGDAVISNAGKAFVNGSAVPGIDSEQQNQILSQSNAELAALVENALLGYELVATNTLFVVQSPTVGRGVLSVQTSRIYAYAPAVHTLAVLCAVSGVILIIVFLFHAKDRRPLYLVDRPGTTIGAVGAMLSAGSSGKTPGPGETSFPSKTGDYFRNGNPNSFIDMLEPGDTNEIVEEKLKHKRFRLNPATGTVELHGDVSDEMYQSSSGLGSKPPTEMTQAPSFPVAHTAPA